MLLGTLTLTLTLALWWFVFRTPHCVINRIIGKLYGTFKFRHLCVHSNRVMKSSWDHTHYDARRMMCGIRSNFETNNCCWETPGAPGGDSVSGCSHPAAAAVQRYTAGTTDPVVSSFTKVCAFVSGQLMTTRKSLTVLVLVSKRGVDDHRPGNFTTLATYRLTDTMTASEIMLTHHNAVVAEQKSPQMWMSLCDIGRVVFTDAIIYNSWRDLSEIRVNSDPSGGMLVRLATNRFSYPSETEAREFTKGGKPVKMITFDFKGGQWSFAGMFT